MGIVRAVGVGKTKGSVGDWTYRVVRGQTIATFKVGRRPLTRAEAVSLQQFTFGLVNRYMFMHAADIQVSFNKTKFGSERNYFAKINFPELRLAFRNLYRQGETSVDSISDAQIEAAVATYAAANPTSIYRVKKTGFPAVYLTGEWSSEDNPIEVVPDVNSPRFEALQDASGNAYSGNTEELYIQGQNLDRVTSIALQVKEADSAAVNPSDVAFQLQGDGRLKVTFSYELVEPLGGGLEEVVVRGTPAGSITWTK